MFKNLFIAILFTYIILTGAYFLNKHHKFVDISFKTDTTTETFTVSDYPLNCSTYSIGHVSEDGTAFRVHLRRLFDKQEVMVDEARLLESIVPITCDRAGQRALIYYNSVPVATAVVESYDYSKPIALETDDEPILYTVLRLEQKLEEFPKTAYIVAVFDYNPDLMPFYSYVSEVSSRADESMIAGNIDTIYYETQASDPSKTEPEYYAIRTKLNYDSSLDLMSVLSIWHDPELPSNVNYMTLFNMHINPQTNSAYRYSLFPMTTIRRSTFELFQLIDLDNSGYKETILKKTRDNVVSFTIYKYDIPSSSYLEIGSVGDHAGE